MLCNPKRANTVQLILILGVLGGCQLPQSAPIESAIGSKVSQAIVGYTQKAREFEARGELFQAIEYWQIVATMQPDSIDASTSISRLQDIVASDVSYYLSIAQAETSRGSYNEALPYLLNALALSPNHAEAIRMLREVKRLEALASLPKEPKKIKSRKFTSDSIDEMFELGLSLISTNKPEARKLFESILEINPNHLAARAYLEVLTED